MPLPDALGQGTQRFDHRRVLVGRLLRARSEIHRCATTKSMLGAGAIMKEGEFVVASVGTRTDFLRAELLVGMTRAKIAQNATEDGKRERNRLEARKAYNTVLRFLPRTVLSQGERLGIESKLTELRFVLQSLGENV